MKKQPSRKPRLEQVVRTFEVSAVEAGDGAIHFRLEIIKSGSRFRGQVLRWEFFRLQPTFPQMRRRPSHRPSDEFVLVRDAEFSELTGASVAAVSRKFAAELQRRFDFARRPFTDLISKHLGVGGDLPSDLLTNPKHFENFGR